MNLTSNILGELGRANKQGAPSPYETEIKVPAQIMPVLELRGVLNAFNPGNVTVQQSTFNQSTQFVVTNAIALSTAFCFFASGLWEIDFNATYSSNYNSVVGGTDAFDVNILNQAGSLSSAIAAGGIAVTLGGQLTIHRKLRVFFDDVFKLSIFLNANGATQTHALYLQVMGAHLL
jgi:hypothetical protein